MSEPKPLKDVLKQIGSEVFNQAVDRLTEADQWREWAIKTLDRVSLQNATNDELQKALEERIRA
jgi:hypothetical protein